MKVRKSLLLVSAAFIAACGTGATTGTVGDSTIDDVTGTTTGSITGTEAGSTDIMAEVTGLQTDAAAFASEVETQAPDSIKNAWSNLELALNDLGSAADDLTLTTEELAPLQDAADQVTDAVAADGAQLSEEFRQFWTDFTSRITALAS